MPTEQATPSQTPAAPQLEIRPLVKKDEQDQVIATITPVCEVIQRGELEGSPFITIKVTKENLNEYVKFRGLDKVLDTLNSAESLDSQEALNYVATQQEREMGGKEEIFIDLNADLPEDKKPKNKKGEVLPKWAIDFSKFSIDRLYQTLLEGKVRGGLTIAKIEEELLPDLRAQLQKAIADGTKATDIAKKMEFFAKAGELSTKHQELEEQAKQIRDSRTPRMTKAEKAAKLAAEAAKNGQTPVAAPAQG
jgi:hypothetical protein